MKLVMLCAALLALATPAMAQGFGARPNQFMRQQPAQSRTTYDWQSGNSYRTTPNYDGSTTVRGNNYQNGSTWTTKIQPDGNQRGTDANGNMWNYNARSGSYTSTDGTVCVGHGYARVCN